jgi:hypothetical protein
MLLIVFLIVPIIFWLIPFARMQQQDRNEFRRFIINFGTMLSTLAVTGFVLGYLMLDITTLFIILFAISAIWGGIFHLISNRVR